MATPFELVDALSKSTDLLRLNIGALQIVDHFLMEEGGHPVNVEAIREAQAQIKANKELLESFYND